MLEDTIAEGEDGEGLIGMDGGVGGEGELEGVVDGEADEAGEKCADHGFEVGLDGDFVEGVGDAVEGAGIEHGEDDGGGA